ncbi:zf-HC2 domain-containing protein [candidate division KSB1 bacterium]|nr:zf-HC2 domain-containing protein [candidate division KSB1 bacterium]
MLLLDIDLSLEERKRLQMHLQQCPACQELTREIDDFYKVLLQELRFPISNHVLKFAETVSHDSMQLGILIGNAAEGESKNGEREFRLRFVKPIEEAPTGLQEKADLVINRNQIVLRVMVDSACKNRLLSLWFVEMDDSREWVLRLPAIGETIRLNRNGFAAIPPLPLEKLEGSMAFLAGAEPTAIEESRFARLTRALALV